MSSTLLMAYARILPHPLQVLDHRQGSAPVAPVAEAAG